MANSNLHVYPLPYPTEDQRLQISTYSSLANALGTDLGSASRQEQRPFLTNNDTVVDKQTIYLTSPPVSNPAYPYPARNVLNPGTYPARAPFFPSNGRYTSDTSVASGENHDRDIPHQFPPWYILVPQPLFVEPEEVQGHQVGAEFSPVQFLRKGNKNPYSIWDLLVMDTMPDLVAGDLPVFVQAPDRWIKVKLIWPGYSRYMFEKRVPIKRSSRLTPSLLLMILAYHMHEFARYIQSEGAVVEPGQERWTITEVPDGTPALWKKCVITSLKHLAGSVWQPEIYYLRE